MPDGDLHLGAHGLGHGVHQGKEAVRRPARDDLQLPRVAVVAEGLDEIRAVDLAEDTADVGELAEVEARDVVEALVLARRAGDLLLREGNQAVEVTVVALDEQPVAHHGEERRRQRHGEAIVHAVPEQAIEHADEGHVGLG